MFDSQFAPGKYPTVGTYPLEQPSTSPMFPPVCYKSHWDPTAMSKYMTPQIPNPAPVSFRPMTRICTSYVTAGETPASKGTMHSVDTESVLRRLDRPLGIHDNKQYLPPLDSDMYTYKKIAVPRALPDPTMISELEMPQALIRDDMPGYYCRKVADRVALSAAAGQMFGHPTKQAKYWLEKTDKR